jgi:cysteine synthase
VPAQVLGKAEWMNPAGSIKDRAALYLIEDAEARGALKPGGTVVEGTAGNTGIGLAHLCNAKGYKLIIYMPSTVSSEKVDLLRLLGAEVRSVPPVPITDASHFTFQARDCAAGLKNAVWTNQFDNTVRGCGWGSVRGRGRSLPVNADGRHRFTLCPPIRRACPLPVHTTPQHTAAQANRHGHLLHTGPEIWAQTGGRLDGFTCATGTGGTLAGVAMHLKEVSKGATQVYLADPPGSVLYSYVTSRGKRMDRSGGSITEGIGQGRVTDNLVDVMHLIDGALFVDDARTIAMVYRLLKDEGIFAGPSSALNVVAAGDLARKLGPGKTVVTVICDGAHRYQGRLFSRKWLESKGLLAHVPDDCAHLVTLP